MQLLRMVLTRDLDREGLQMRALRMVLTMDRKDLQMLPLLMVLTMDREDLEDGKEGMKELMGEVRERYM